jgi:hypothetical protein
VLEFCVEDFCQAINLIGQFHEMVRSGRIPQNSSMSMVIGELTVLRRHCIPLGLTSTLAQIDRVEEMFDANRNYTYPQISTAILEVSSRLRDELEARKIYMVSAERNAYLAGTQFAPSVGERFPDAIEDMDEAARCFAFERPTACIFHLMRVTEHGVKAIADLLEIKDHAPTWEPIIRKIDDELKTPYKDRKYKGDQDLLANMSTHLHAVKVAWRNKTMHIEKVNTMPQAKKVYDATCGLMDYLATGLPQKKPGIVQAIRGKLGV